MNNEELVKTFKNATELMSIHQALYHITKAYKYDKIDYNQFVELLNFIQRHKTDFKYE